MNELISQRLALAEQAARAAGDKALDYFNRRESLVIETKRDAQDVVSIADREVELLIREANRPAVPERRFFGGGVWPAVR